MGSNIYAYDELGNQVCTCLDVDGDDIIDTNGLDRITGTETRYEKDGSDWWRRTETVVYAAENSGASTTTSVHRVRLTGFSGQVTEESRSLDVHGNETVTTTEIDRNAARMTRTVDYPDSSLDEVAFSLNGLVVSNITRSGTLTVNSYDALERLTNAVSDASGSRTTHYDSNGRVDYEEDAAGYRTGYVYDSGTGRRVAVTNANGDYTRYAYDVLGNVTCVWGQATYPVSYAYDALGRMTGMTTYRSGAGWTNWTWPGGTGDTTAWQYDEATGLLTNKLYADGWGVSYDYDAAGRLQTRTWARGVTTTYAYDAGVGEMTNIAYSGSTTTNISFTYDRMGRRKTVTDAVGTWTYAYGPSLQLTNEACSGVVGLSLARGYSASGFKGRGSGFGIQGGQSVEYGYDGYGRMSMVAWTNQALLSGGVAGYLYAPGTNLLTSTVLSNQQFTAQRFYADPRRLLTGVINLGNVGVSTYAYDLDPDGLRTGRNDTVSGRSPTNTMNSFGYNGRDELTTAQMGTNSYGYIFDPIGNRTSMTENAAFTAYVANELNQYTNITPAVTNELLYDEDGNLTTDWVTGYTWDAENRLIRAEPVSPSNGSRKVEFLYDYLGRRARKIAYTYSGSSWTAVSTNLYAYDGWNLVRETELDAAGAATNWYAWGLDLSQSLQGAGGIGGLLARTRHTGSSTQSIFYCYDGNGNVVQLLDETGTNVLARYEYGPFGDITTQSGAVSTNNPFRFSTKYQDDETGLVYYGYRYYDPELGRWPSRDPLGEKGSVRVDPSVMFRPIDEDEGLRTVGSGRANAVQYPLVKDGPLNLYAFIDNDSINSVDKDGRLRIRNCSAAREAQIRSAFNSMCNQLNDSSFFSNFRCCMWRDGCTSTRRLSNCLKSRCSSARLTIKCNAQGTGLCSPGTGGYVWYAGRSAAVHICDLGFNPSRFDLTGVIFHELTHTCGFMGETEPYRAQWCLGVPAPFQSAPSPPP